MKKQTLKERQAALRCWTDNFCVEVHAQLIQTRPHFFYVDELLKDGKPFMRIQCEACGADSLETIRHFNDLACPVCGNKNQTHYIKDRKKKLFIEDNENGWIAALYEAEYYDVHRKKQNLHEIAFEDRVEILIHPTAVLQYHKEYGFLLYTKNYASRQPHNMSFINARDARYEDTLRQFRKHKDTEIDMNAKLQQATQEYAAAQELAFKNKTLGRVQASEMEYLQYQPKDLDLDAMLKFPKLMLYNRYTHTNKELIYTVTCTVCDTNFHTQDIGDAVCPTCGNKIFTSMKEFYADEFYAGRYPASSVENIIFMHYENTDLPGDELLLRLFYATYHIDRSGKVKTEIQEERRYFLGRRKKAFDVKRGQLVKIKPDFTKYPSYCHMITAHTKEELCEIFANSALRYSGAMEAMGCCESPHKPIADINSLDYLQAWYQNPGVEYVFKSQLRELTVDCLNNGAAKLLKKGKNIKEVLGLSNLGVQIMRHYNLGMEDLKSVQTLCQDDPTLTLEGFQQLKENVNLRKAADIIKDHHVSCKDVINYINSVYMHQCIEKEDAIEVWYDYLNMATKVGFDLSDRSKKFPSSLRKEHDIAMFAYKSVQSDINAEEFAKQALINKKKYEYAYGDLIALVPQTAEAVAQEAKNQHNCLRSYIDAIKNGRTAVAFIRRKDASHKSYVSVEVHESSILQIKGFANSNPRCAELDEFLKHWCADKNLRLCCFY